MSRGLAAALIWVFVAMPLDASAQAAPDRISPAARLRKLSLHLRGLIPSRPEFEALEAALKGADAERFFQAKASEYVKTPQHVGKMMTRLDELFRVRTTNGLPEDQKILEDDTDRHKVDNAMDALFRSLAAGNLSWDQLLVGKDYLVHQRAGYDYDVNDLGFFNLAHPSLPPSTTGVLRRKEEVSDNYEEYGSASNKRPRQLPIPIQFETDDPRIAGAVTTLRFLRRYNTTALNKNRRRAAAVFRIFLCDDMKPVLMPSKDENAELLKMALEGTSGGAEMAAEKSVKPKHPRTMQAKHGTDPMCMSCHFKLDPLGKAFMSAENILGPEPAPGALVFDRVTPSGKTRVNIPGRGLGDLAKALVEQPEYAACQVRHFWKWFIGSDVELSQERLEELTRKFNDVGRRTNDFVATIVNEPEFHASAVRTSAAPAPSWKTAKPWLGRCSACHISMDSAPDFAKLPIGGSREAQREWLLKIAANLDLAGGGMNPSMPPRNAAWPAMDTREAASAIRDWLCAGAPDQAGVQGLNTAELPKGVCR